MNQPTDDDNDTYEDYLERKEEHIEMTEQKTDREICEEATPKINPRIER